MAPLSGAADGDPDAEGAVVEALAPAEGTAADGTPEAAGRAGADWPGTCGFAVGAWVGSAGLTGLLGLAGLLGLLGVAGLLGSAGASAGGLVGVTEDLVAGATPGGSVSPPFWKLQATDPPSGTLRVETPALA